MAPEEQKAINNLFETVNNEHFEECKNTEKIFCFCLDHYYNIPLKPDIITLQYWCIAI